MSTVVDVQGELTVFTVHALKDRLLNALTPGSDLLIKLNDVTEVDGAGLQLLLATRHEARRQEIAMRLQAPPEALQAALALTGLSGEFDVVLPNAEEALA
ncbi:MAG: anti-sigma factor antagonist [Aquabacterium sp.]|uniref:STAS domain-containing protein n=1 Tax=Aquabacterium sp. TaxID=1872578 RepID=UPI00122B9479|nr:STAS domain-containing protein [Aquabacterium sp.]TAK88747.1 MAG: anti-sigma factor antagonist [Aquabacterium sp.]